MIEQNRVVVSRYSYSHQGGHYPRGLPVKVCFYSENAGIFRHTCIMLHG